MGEITVFFYKNLYSCIFFSRLLVLNYLKYIRKFIFIFFLCQINFFLRLNCKKKLLLKNIFFFNLRGRLHSILFFKNFDSFSYLRRVFYKHKNFDNKIDIFNPFLFFVGTDLNILQIWLSSFLFMGKRDITFFLMLKFFLLFRILNLNLTQLFLFFFLRLILCIEVRSLHLRRRRHFVPFLLSTHRQIFVVLKIFSRVIIKKQKNYTSFFYYIIKYFK